MNAQAMSLQLPTIHLNGTSRETLLEDTLAAATALREAVEALQRAAPNARDFYPQGPDAFPKARREHEARLHKLADIIHELQIIAEHVAG